MAEIQDRVVADAECLTSAGFDGLIVENFGDNPFLPRDVEPHTVAAMTLLSVLARDVSSRVRPKRVPVLGLNVLRNDATAAMAIAAVISAAFIRVNVHVGAMVTDQGIIEGRAYETLRYRRSLDARVGIWADVFVKHAYPLGMAELGSTARDTFFRGGAEALIISGHGTGEPTDLDQVAMIRHAAPGAPILIGSGISGRNLETACSCTDGAIVGTALKELGEVERPVEFERARSLVEMRDQVWGRRGRSPQ
jgi:hypothetical protein